MKSKFTLLLISAFLLSGGMLFGQAFIIDAPLEIGGGYEFAAAGFGRTLTDSVWTAEVVFVDDGSPIPSEGCNELLNPDEVSNKIALIDRGSCEFGLKSLNAENAGAIAAVVVNTAPGAGAIVMGAGAVGNQVTIPCLMIPYEVGQLIRNAMINGETVTVSLGNLEPPPPPANDLAVANSNILVPRLGIIPASQVQEPGDFVFTPGATINNRGLNAAPNYKLDLVITHTPFGGEATEVYRESTESEDDIMPGDTAALYLFPEFDPVVAGLGSGIYRYTYSVSSDSTDDASFNNAATGSFTLTDFTENGYQYGWYSKATWNTNTMGPNYTATIGLTSNALEFLTPLHIPYGEGYKIDSVTFDVRLTPSLAGVNMTAYVYQWNDANEDLSFDDGELEAVGLAVYTFPEDETEDRVVLRLPFLDFISFEEVGVEIPQNDMLYVVGARYEGTNAVSLGFDANLDYDRTADWKTANGAITELDYGLLAVSMWENGLPVISDIGFLSDRADATAIRLTSLTSGVKDIAGADEFEMSLFPNPVKNQLQVNVEFKEKAEFIEFYAYDSAGRLVLHKRSTDVFDTVQQTFDASQLPAGQYHLVIRTGLGIQAKPFVVQR
ncbi:MAG: T9SS type A sorting domain-containing protein [Phaeodactylibacter sp.]|nr:T9SS type A sorting domain-containing protein [Phaeodactylibacter sp.]